MAGAVPRWRRQEAEGEVMSERCTCGSGGHPRRCAQHPGAYEEHVAELNQIGAEERIAELEAELAALRERAEKAERERDDYRSELHSVGEALALANATTLDLIGMRSELRAAQARLARYEAPGPALLTAEHGDYCYSVVAPGDDNCSCTKAIIDAAYREQHARCMAVVERLMREIDEDPRASHLGLYAGGVRMALAALTGEAEK